MSRRRAVLWMHDLAGNQVDAIGHGFLDLFTDERLDQSERLVFEIPTDHPKIGRIVGDTEILYEGRRYYIVEPETNRDGSATTVQVEADALWYRLGEIAWVGSIVLEDLTPAEGVAAILDGTAWSVDSAATPGTVTFSMEAQDRSRLDLLRAWAKVTRRHLRFDTAARLVYLAESPGAASGLSFRYGRNIKGLRKRERPPEVTVLYPFGADDLTISGANAGVPYVEDFSYYTAQGLDLATARDRYTKSVPWVDSSFVREADLLAAAEERIAALAQPSYVYELDVVDLSELTAVTERARIGQTVRVYDPDLGDDLRPIVVRVQRHPLEPWRNVIELGTLPNPLGDGSSSSRPSSADSWEQFVGPVRANYEVRNDGTYTVARIPLRFRDGGRAHYHLDLFAVGVGSGDMIVTVVDTQDGNAQQFRQLTIPYTNGETVRAHMSWAAENLDGRKVYAVRVSTIADGGPSASAGVDVDPDAGYDVIADGGTYEASFWILAQGAVQESPTAPNSVRFDYVSNATQPWTVPDNVEEITVELVGAAGGPAGSIDGGGGGRVSFSMAVVPGTELDIYAPRQGYSDDAFSGLGGWPGGGSGGGPPSNHGGGGGGYAAIIPAGGSLVDAWAVAGGGGGGGGSGGGIGGDGGYPEGAAGGTVGSATGGGGGTQTAGGIGGDTPAADGSFGQGGSAIAGGGLSEGGGGGGGGWYGGGGGRTGASAGGGGGGGSGYIDPDLDALEISIEDGANTGNGYVEISWETPLFGE